MEYRVLDVATRQPREDVVQWVKVSGAAWAGNGFFYSRYPAPTGGRDLSAKNVNHEVYFHTVGTPQSTDQKVFSDPANPERFHTVEVTEDERFLILTVSDRGKGKKGNAVFYRDLASTDTTFHPIVEEIGDDTFTVIDNIGATFLVYTDRKAPNGRVFLFDPKMPAEAAWKDVLPERAEPLDGVSTGGGKLFASYLKDVTSRSYVFDLSGRQEHEIPLPGPGTVAGLGGRQDDTQIFYTYTSFNYPPTIFRYDIAAGQSAVFRRVDIPGFSADAYDVTQVFGDAHGQWSSLLTRARQRGIAVQEVLSITTDDGQISVDASAAMLAARLGPTRLPRDACFRNIDSVSPSAYSITM